MQNLLVRQCGTKGLLVSGVIFEHVEAVVDSGANVTLGREDLLSHLVDLTSFRTGFGQGPRVSDCTCVSRT